MSKTSMMSIHILLMRLFPAFCGGKALKWKCQTFCLTWPVTSQVTPGSNFSTISERSRPGLSFAVWIFPPRLLVSEIDGGRYRSPPPAKGTGRTGGHLQPPCKISNGYVNIWPPKLNLFLQHYAKFWRHIQKRDFWEFYSTYRQKTNETLDFWGYSAS